uniref:Uncharacterized protein n=1 Tax=Anguilla anguilla TaxID=7936 RepID=A0A0E9RAM9_ANGAN
MGCFPSLKHCLSGLTDGAEFISTGFHYACSTSLTGTITVAYADLPCI